MAILETERSGNVPCFGFQVSPLDRFCRKRLQLQLFEKGHIQMLQMDSCITGCTLLLVHFTCFRFVGSIYNSW